MSERKGKMNFSVSEINKITEKVEENLDVIQSILTNSITNKKKQAICAKITAEVNSIGVAERSVQDIKDKWKNMHSLAKKEFAIHKNSIRIMGGGPPPKPHHRQKKLWNFLNTCQHQALKHSQALKQVRIN